MTHNIVHVLDDKGHRGAYIELFASVFNFSPIVEQFSPNKILLFLRADRVLFATVNLGKSFKWFFMISLIRAVLLKPTCLILLGGVKYLDDLQPTHVKLKKCCLRLLKRFYKQTTLSIIPYHLDRRLSTYTKNYIYDPQMWDMYCSEYSSKFNTDVDYAKKQVAYNGKPIVIFLGKVTERKGLKEFIKFVETNKKDFQFVVAGRISSKNIAYTNQLENLGVKVIDEFIEESKFLGFYEIADFVWCYYKPSYDQTSGVFGRAIQLGCIPIVRKGSLISHIAKINNLPCVELDFESEHQIKKIPVKLNKIVAENDLKNSYFKEIKDDSLNKLKRYLYI